MKRLMGEHGTREPEVDELLRGEVFVDLYAVVRQARAHRQPSRTRSSRSRSSTCTVTTPARSMDGGEQHRRLRGVARGSTIRRRLDEHRGLQPTTTAAPRSSLRDWLEARRTEAEAQFGEIPRPEAKDGTASEEISERDAELAALADALSTPRARRSRARDDEQHARWLLAQTARLASPRRQARLVDVLPPHQLR